ncbi:Basigin [Folsomia candida]|uniref:Basigin n=2 Tax=Folsomia candida TaxID=158441 RepID=A0A226EVX7_FOLCA|nr:Basigin [Folsomia candida]
MSIQRRMASEFRTQCLPSPTTNDTAFISPTSNNSSASSGTRKRTRIPPPPSSTSGGRMTLFTLIYISLAVIILFLSPSAYADAIPLMLSTNATLKNGKEVYKEYVARGKHVDITCTAPVPDAELKWYRLVNGQPEDMDKVCGVPDVELSDRKKPPVHCKVNRDVKSDSVIIKLEIKRVRKEDNDTLGTVKDFRKYMCKANRGNNEGKKEVEVAERVSATRTFDHRGVMSLTVTEGEKLQIYCDIHGVNSSDFEGSNPKVELKWTKDGEDWNPYKFAGPEDIIKIGRVEETEKGKPYRSGYNITMAERDHRGFYTCSLVRRDDKYQSDQYAGPSLEKKDPDKSVEFTYYVRVKDKLGALWPFLGICGEVIILCAIILIYEKRKSKAELEESDTDGSPDQ